MKYPIFLTKTKKKVEISLLDDIKKYNITNLVVDDKDIYAHINKYKRAETLKEHSELAFYFLERLLKEKGIKKILSNTVKNLKIKDKKEEEIISDKVAKMIFEMFINAVYLHDIGKINPSFQKNKMKNRNIKFDKSYDTYESNHSLLSALIYIDIYLERINKVIKNPKERKYLYNILYSFSFLMSRHHTYLKNLSESEFINELENKLNKLEQDDFEVKFYKYKQRLIERSNLNKLRNRAKNKHNPIELYILCKLLYSSIVSCDFYATYAYTSSSEPEFNYIENIDNIFNVYKNTDIYKGIQRYKKDKNYFGENSINTLRSEMFLEAEDNLIKQIDKSNIYYLEAPTGSGKTNTSINLALNIIKNKSEYNKIFYIFPFNTLVEQTKKTFDEIFNNKIQKKFRVAVINSITPIITEEEMKENEDIDSIDYGKDLLNRQMLHYPVVLTTHINFFNYLFGIGREVNLPLVHLCNSVVIIDEVQSYRNMIWPEIIEFLNIYSKLLNIKIIIMSATLPRLDKLTRNGNVNFGNLIKDKNKYYKNKLFKGRVNLNFDLLKKNKIDEKELIEAVEKVFEGKKESRVLVEFITKKSARYFYGKFKERFKNKFPIVEITGDDSSFNRKKILKLIKEKDDKGDFKCKTILVVATQVIEAGIDIDMDIGFKDISMLDGEEQFLGRINRSCKRSNCWAYFFNYDDGAKIYKNDFRLEHNLLKKEYQQYLLNKDFTKFYEKCFIRLDEKKNEHNENNIEGFYNIQVSNLDFKEILEHMKLITDKNYQIFLAYKVTIDNGDILDGVDVWQEYKELLENDEMDYAKKKIYLSRVAEKMSYFTYNYLDFGDRFDRTPKFSNENIGNIYYIEDGEMFLTKEGKFDREKYNNISGGSIL